MTKNMLRETTISYNLYNSKDAATMMLSPLSILHTSPFKE